MEMEGDDGVSELSAEYPIPSWMGMSTSLELTKDLNNEFQNEAYRKKPKAGMTWSTFLAYVERCSLHPQRFRTSYFGDEIGRGKFFEVYRYKVKAGEHSAFRNQKDERLSVGTIVALKRVIPQPHTDNTISLEDGRQLQAIATEIRALTRLSLREHENIIEMYALAWEDRGQETALWPTIIMEYCPCTLAELQSERKSPLSPLLKCQLIQGISLGVHALHCEDIIHGDIKSENVLIKVIDDGLIIPKLADFGSSIVQIDATFVEIGGTDPWRAPECITQEGKISLDLAFVTDAYSLGLLYWRIIRNGRDPFKPLYRIDHQLHGDDKEKERKLDHGQTKPLATILLDQEAKERVCIKDAIQKLKLSGAVIQMAIDDIKYLKPPDEKSSTGFKIMFSALLQADPVARWEALGAIGQSTNSVQDVDITRDAGEDSLHPSAAKKININQFPTTLFSVHDMVRKEILNPELRIGEPTRRRIFQELLRVAQRWENYKYPECKGCCGISPFDKLQDEPLLSPEDYLQYIMVEADTHTCTSENTMLYYEIQVGEEKIQQNEIFIVILNLVVCYVDGYGVKADIEEGLSWLLKAGRWGSMAAQNELATCLLQLGKPLPSDTPLVKWLMQLTLLWDLPSTRKSLYSLSPKCYEIARLARWMVFDGTSTKISNWTFDPEKEINLDEFNFQRDSAKVAASQTSGKLETGIGVDKMGNQRDWWDDNSVIHYIASSWRQPVDLCRTICRKYIDLVNIPNPQGESPLLLACRSKRLLMISLLIDLGADASQSAGRGGETPLHWLVLVDDDDGIYNTIERLLACGADINALNTEVRVYSWRPVRPALWRSAKLFYLGSPLHWAVLAGDTKMVKFLVEKGAHVGIKSTSGETPVSIAVSMRRSDLVQALLEDQHDFDLDLTNGILLWNLFFDSTSFTRLMLGFNEEDERETLEALLRWGPQQNNEEEVAIYFRHVIRRGISAMPYGLLSKLLDGLERSYQALSSKDSIFAEKPLARETWSNLDLIHDTVKRNEPTILDLILRKGADIREREIMDYTCLHTLSVYNGNKDCLQILLKHGAQVDWRTNNGWLPFHFAVLAGNMEIAQALKDTMPKELFQDAVDLITNTRSSKFSMTFFGHAIKLRSLSFGSVKGIEWLLNLPEDVTDFKTVCPDGKMSPLHVAVDGIDCSSGVFREYGKLPVLRLLLTKFNTPEHLDLPSSDDFTALHIAVLFGKFEESRLLVEAGADFNALSKHGTPLDAAFMDAPRVLNEMELGPTREMLRRFMEGRNAIAKYLRRKGAKCVAELQVDIKLGDWVPYAINSGEHVEYFQYSTFARMRWGRRKYGRAPVRPRLRPEPFMEGELRSRDLVPPQGLAEWNKMLDSVS